MLSHGAMGQAQDRDLDMQLDTVGLHVTVSSVGMNEITPRSNENQNPGDHPHLRDELRNQSLKDRLRNLQSIKNIREILLLWKLVEKDAQSRRTRTLVLSGRYPREISTEKYPLDFTIRKFSFHSQ